MQDVIKASQPFLFFKAESYFCSHVATMGLSHIISFCMPQSQSGELTFLGDCNGWIFFAYKNGECKTIVLEPSSEKRELFIEPSSECIALRFFSGEKYFLEPAFILNCKKTLSEASSFDDAKERVLALLSFRSESKKSKLSLFRQISFIIEHKKGIVKISELEHLSGYSSRYMNHIFELQLGMSAKQFSLIVKMRNILDELNESQSCVFSKLAQRYCFYDQSHFVHEFKSFTGLRPSEYEALSHVSSASKIAV